MGALGDDSKNLACKRVKVNICNVNVTGPRVIAQRFKCAVGWSDFELFWNFKNRHPAIVVGFNSKTKIEKAFFDILRNYRVLCKTFFQKLLNKVRNFFSQNMTLWASKNP